MMEDLHGIMEVTKETETADVDSIVSFVVAKIIDGVVVEAGKKIKSTVEVDEKKRKNRRDGERKRGEKISKVNMTRIACEDEGCERTFKSKSSLQKHLKKKIPSKCEQCDKELMGETQLSIHLKKIHKFVRKFTCNTCYKSFAGVSSLKNHEMNHDSTIAGGKFRCEDCQLYYKQKPTLKSHIKNKHMNDLHELQPEDDQTMVDGIKAVVDEIIEVAVMKAGEKNKSIDDEKKERRKYFRNNKKRIPCEDEGCGKTFKYKGNMEKHLGRKIPAICGKCDKEFNEDRQLSLHMRKIHQHIRKFTCKTCNNSFRGEKSLKNHEMNHDSTIAGGKFRCEDCQLYYRQKHTLKSHIKNKHMEMVGEGMRIVTGGYMRNSAGKAWINPNCRVVIELEEKNKENNEENNTEKKMDMQIIGWKYINETCVRAVIEDRCGEGGLCCRQRVGGDAEVEQSVTKHRGGGIVKEILDEIISAVGKKVKFTPDKIQQVGGDVEVEKSVGRGGKKVNKKKIHKKVGVVGGENIVRKKKGGGVPCEEGHCHKKFDSKWNMKRHLEAEIKMYCNHCEKGLMGPRNLMSHMKRKHEEFLKKLECEKCDAKFPSEKSLSMHMKMHDPNYGKFECENCILFFTQKHSMERHRRNFHK